MIKRASKIAISDAEARGQPVVTKAPVTKGGNLKKSIPVVADAAAGVDPAKARPARSRLFPSRKQRTS